MVQKIFEADDKGIENFEFITFRVGNGKKLPSTVARQGIHINRNGIIHLP
ncbi:MAG: hypothetical protein LBO71_07995 [Prevotellaceae bacterium]|jgi:hypothetical protein|nr:hypothetical protein [Prevotellaceae bacterium]